MSCFPLRPLRLRGGNSFVSFLFRAIPCSSVANAFQLISCLPIKTAKAKNFYRKDAKDAKKQQPSLDFLFYFAPFESSRWKCLIPFLFRVYPWQMLSRWFLIFIGNRAKAKNFYRKDAKDAKKQQRSLDVLFSFAPFASSRWNDFMFFSV